MPTWPRWTPATSAWCSTAGAWTGPWRPGSTRSTPWWCAPTRSPAGTRARTPPACWPRSPPSAPTPGPPACRRRSRSPPPSAAPTRARCPSDRCPRGCWSRWPRPGRPRSPWPTPSGSPSRSTSAGASPWPGRWWAALGNQPALPLPQHPQHRPGQRHRRGGGRRHGAGRVARRHRRLPVRPQRHRQHPDRGPGLPAGAHGLPHRRGPGSGVRHRPVAGEDGGAPGARLPVQGRDLPGLRPWGGA